MVSHRSTGEWQSFETRMRRRRAERLVLRAEVAADAGCIDDALLCLAEARSLAPSLPGLDALQQKLSGPPIPTSAGARARGRGVAAVFAAVAATGALAAWIVVTRPAAAIGAVSASPQASASAIVTDAAPSPAAPKAQLMPRLPDAATRTATATIPPLVSRRLPRTEPDRAPATPPAQDTIRDSILKEVARVADLPMPGSATETIAPIGVLDLPAAAPAPPVAEPAREPSQEPAVRSVLDRYAAAYSALDVEAAQRVWPSVNRGALSRAFDSLTSQRVSLGDCRIEVMGQSATARCLGTTTWSPKIGDDGRRTEARSWTFALARAGAGWEIVSARVQNR